MTTPLGDLTAFSTSGFSSVREPSTHATLKINGIYNDMGTKHYYILIQNPTARGFRFLNLPKITKIIFFLNVAISVA